jgi:beta-glucosidase
MKKIFKIIGKVIAVFILLVLGLGISVFGFLFVKDKMASSENLELLGGEAPSLEVASHSFRDLNKNGKLDIYEDSRADVESRVNDLSQQMNLEEKAGLMFITMIAMNNDGSVTEAASPINPFSLLLEASSSMLAKKHMNHFNILQSPSAEAMILWNNNLQKMAERTRLGIPVTIASDPRHGVPNTPGASIITPYYSQWCSAPGFAAIGDTVLMREFGDIARQEYLASGIRLTLSPMADLATEPRWARINGTFGEDAELSAKLTKAYILGFQGDSITSTSVECMAKHFSGGGPQEDGIDAHFPPGGQVYPGNNFDYHLIPFEKGVFAANAAQVMPYYGIPKGQTSEDVGFGYNKDIVTGMLREKYHFDGIVCTDWGLISDVGILGMAFKPAAAHGVEHLSTSERVAKIIDAGCDMFGGEAMPEEVMKLVVSGEISEERINLSVKRILREKFKLGLFDNPYVAIEMAENIGTPEFMSKGLESQQRSLVLLKNESQILPLKPTLKVYLQGFEKGDEAFLENAVSNPKEADIIILKFTTPYVARTKYLMERVFHQGSLEFQGEEKEELLKLIKTKPTITVINLERPAVIPEINEQTKGLIADFGSGNKVILDLIFGKFKPEGKLPFELPSSMVAVENQKEDVPYDSVNPLYKFGAGMTY